MKQSLPSVVMTNENLMICFSDSLIFRSVKVKCVVDLTDFRDVLGIEVLDWRRQLSGGGILGAAASEKLHWSYDAEIDALYIRLHKGYSQIQKSTTCTVSLDAEGNVVDMRLLVSEATR